MERTPREQGAHDALCAIESTRRLGLTKEQVLAHYLGVESGIQGALNAAWNTYGEDAPAEIVAEYAVAWVAALIRLALTGQP